VGAGLLELERRLGMDRWFVGCPPSLRRRLGRPTLGQARSRLRLGWRPLAV